MWLPSVRLLKQARGGRVSESDADLEVTVVLVVTAPARRVLCEGHHATIALIRCLHHVSCLTSSALSTTIP
jgi:hypothetical protein